MNELRETFTVTDGYDKRKEPRQFTVRKVTLEEIRAGLTLRHYWILDRHGKARQIRCNGSVKGWKRDANRFECGFKYGMYETFRLGTQEMLDQLLIEV